MTDASREYLAYIRRTIDENRSRLDNLGQQVGNLEIEVAKVRKDLKEWEQIERLIAIKIGDVEELGESASSQESPGSAVVSYEDTDGTCDASLAIESDDEPESNGSTEAFDFHGMTYAQVAEFALKRLGRPARASEIRDELLSLGYVVNKDSKVATNILYNSLDRSKRVSRTSDGRWSLAAKVTTE